MQYGIRSREDNYEPELNSRRSEASLQAMDKRYGDGNIILYERSNHTDSY